MGRAQPFQPQPIALADWLNRFIEDYLLTHELPAEALLSSAEPNLVIEFDPDQLHQVVWNLCDNGIQHTETEQPLPWLELTANHDPASNKTTISVSDKGPGVPDEQIEHLFTPFFTTRDSGTGLGLYVAKELCTTNRAALTYKKSSRPGARFDITFDNSQATLNL